MRHSAPLLLLLTATFACAPSAGDLDDAKTDDSAATTTGPGDDGGEDGGGTSGDDGGGDGGGDDGDNGGDSGGGGDDGTTGSADGDLHINEFMASNASGIQDAGGAYPDWIELYNAGEERVDLGGWTITDDLDEPGKHALASTLSIEAGGFLLLFADDDEEEGDSHLSFKLAATGEAIGLYRPDGQAIDEITFEEMGTDISMARVPDGSSTWEVTDNATPGASNGG